MKFQRDNELVLKEHMAWKRCFHAVFRDFSLTNFHYLADELNQYRKKHPHRT